MSVTHHGMAPLEIYCETNHTSAAPSAMGLFFCRVSVELFMDMRVGMFMTKEGK